MHIRSTVFDFDGTLLDSKPGIVNCLHSVGTAYGLDTLGVADWIIGPPAEISIGRLMPGASEALRREFLAEFRRCYALHGWSDCSLYPGIVDLLCDLKRSHIRAYICTSKRKDLTVRLLDHFHLQGYFSAVAADEDHLASHDKKDLLIGLLERENIDAASCVMIGDSKYDMDAARAARLKAVAVLYGYGNREELVASEPDALCESPLEIFTSIDLL
jgi:phosphoglycolate phosphatase